MKVVVRVAAWVWWQRLWWYGGEGGHEVRRWCVMEMITMVLWGSWCYEGGGVSEVVVTVRWWWWRVTESEYGDRVDPVVRTTFGVRRKNPPENFSGGGVVVAGRRLGGFRRPEFMGRERV
ncbi:hypothetical protein Tco_0034895, partial [Tanacetum coccineum]